MKGEHFSEIRGVLATVLWLDPNIHLEYWSSACGHQKVFRPRMPYTKHYLGMCVKRGALSKMFGLGYASGVCFGVCFGV